MRLRHMLLPGRADGNLPKMLGKPLMNSPICSMCATEQRGIVLFLWSDGAVVYECRHCGTFNEVPEIRGTRRSFATSGREFSKADLRVVRQPGRSAARNQNA